MRKKSEVRRKRDRKAKETERVRGGGGEINALMQF